MKVSWSLIKFFTFLFRLILKMPNMNGLLSWYTVTTQGMWIWIAKLFNRHLDFRNGTMPKRPTYPCQAAGSTDLIWVLLRCSAFRNATRACFFVFLRTIHNFRFLFNCWPHHNRYDCNSLPLCYTLHTSPTIAR